MRNINFSKTIDLQIITFKVQNSTAQPAVEFNFI